VQLAELNHTIDMEQTLYEQLMRKPVAAIRRLRWWVLT